jgi:hypothetical protein
MRSCLAKVELTCQQSGERLLDALASIPPPIGTSTQARYAPSFILGKIVAGTDEFSYNAQTGNEA